jgi:hypothetical protein
MTPQELFDKVSSHLLNQGQPALDRGECRYRTGTGLSCAVGCLISDAAYSPTFEGQVVTTPRVQWALEASGLVLDQRSLDLLNRLQSLHDLTKPELWPAGLHRIAEKFGLEF